LKTLSACSSSARASSARCAAGGFTSHRLAGAAALRPRAAAARRAPRLPL